MDNLKEDIQQIKDILKLVLKIDSLMLASISTSNTFNPENRRQVVELLKDVNKNLLEMEKIKDGKKADNSCGENNSNSEDA